MLIPLVLASDATVIWWWLWPVFLFMVIGWLLLKIINRVLFGPPDTRNKTLHDRQNDSTKNLPDPWAESARRLKLEPRDDDDAALDDDMNNSDDFDGDDFDDDEDDDDRDDDNNDEPNRRM